MVINVSSSIHSSRDVRVPTKDSPPSIDLVVRLSPLSSLLSLCMSCLGECDRPNLCGSSSEFCSEQSNLFSHVPSSLPSNSTFFACFCPQGLFQIGQPCPELTTTTTSTSTSTSSTSTTSSSTSSTVIVTTTTPIACPRPSSGVRVEMGWYSWMFVFVYFRI